MDKELIRKRFSKASSAYASQATIQYQIAAKMNAKIEQYIPSSIRRTVLEIGCGTGLFTRRYLNCSQPDNLLLNDLCPEMQRHLVDLLDEHICFSACDAETLDFPSGQDLIISCSTIQWFEHPDQFLLRCRDLLTDQGYLAFTTFGPSNVKEIASITGTSLKYYSLNDLLINLSSFYHIVWSEEELVTCLFPSPMFVLKHLKETGVTGVSHNRWTKGQLDAFCQQYWQLHGCANKKVPLTYHPIYMICKKI